MTARSKIYSSFENGAFVQGKRHEAKPSSKKVERKWIGLSTALQRYYLCFFRPFELEAERGRFADLVGFR